MFACIAAGYPREPHAPLPDLIDAADRQLEAGEITLAAHDEVEAAVVRELLQEQELAGLAIVADPVHHPDRLARIVRGLGGTTSSDTIVLADGDSVAAPRFGDTVEWRAPILVEEWLRADAATDQQVKQVLPGPYTIASLAHGVGRARDRLALALGEALNNEARALLEAGCPIVQIDEGAITGIGDDSREWSVVAETQRRLTAGLHDAHLSLGLYGGTVHPAGFDAIFDSPFRSYLVDGLAGPDVWRFVFAAPSDRGVIIGAADAHEPVRDETEVMVWAMAWAAEGGRGHERVGLAPNGSLTSVGRHMARRKIERMGEAVRIGSMGPLASVAVSLDPDPLHSRMPALRQLAQAADAARTPQQA